MDAPRPAVILEEGSWDFLFGSVSKIVGLLATILLFFTAVWVISYGGGSAAILTVVFLAGLLGVLALGYVSEIEFRLLVKAITLPLLGIVLITGDMIPRSIDFIVYGLVGVTVLLVFYELLY
ncbi:MAG: hypothetical protein ABEH81_00305 [Halopenitus sp.]